MEAYVDDVVIKSWVKEDLVSDLSETFSNLRRFKWKLNPKKCVFGVPSGKLLGFIVSYRGIEVNPEKIKDIFRMNSPTKLKDVQKLTGCMAALSHFISHLGEWAMPFYKLLKKQDKFQWTPEAQQAFDELKEEHIAVYGPDNHMRLTGLHETQAIDTFNYGLADRGASIRIPHSFINNGYRGYLEDRRPNSLGDPYRIAGRILQTIQTVPSSLDTGCRPLSTSMMLSRRIPSATPSAR